MLRVLRERKASWILRILLILVAVTFISWGGFYLLREKKLTYAAKVGGVTIELADFRKTYQRMYDQYRNSMGPSFTEKMAEELKLKDRALESLVTQALIAQEAKRMGFTVSDEELRQSIESIPNFAVDGRFDPKAYERLLRANRMTVEEFEQSQRQNLLLNKVVNLVRLNAGKVSEDEVLESYRFENEKVNLQFVKVAPESFRGQVSANEVEEKDYYQKQQEEFRVPAQIQIQYLLFRASDFEGKVQVSQEEAKRYYDLQKERFKTSKRVKAREVLLKVGAQDPADKVEEKQKRAAEILERAKKTKDFGSLAKQYSEADSASRGGDLGWVQKGTLEEPLEAALLALKPNEMSGVVRGSSGFYIFKADEVQEAKEKSFEEVKDLILQGLKKEKAKAEASRKGDDAFYAIFRSRDLEKYARENDVPIRTTGWFKEGEEVPEIGKDPSFYTSAFSLKMGEISPLVNVPPNFYILKLVDKKESKIPSFEEVKETVHQKVIRVKSDEKARQVAEEILKQVQSGKTLREVAQEKGLPVEETGFFTRTGGVVPKIGPVGESLRIFASLTEKNPIPKEVFQTKDGDFVVRLLATEPADMAKFDSVKKNFERRLVFQKQEEFFQNWLSQLRDKAKIEINKDVLGG